LRLARLRGRLRLRLGLVDVGHAAGGEESLDHGGQDLLHEDLPVDVDALRLLDLVLGQAEAAELLGHDESPSLDTLTGEAVFRRLTSSAGAWGAAAGCAAAGGASRDDG